MTSQSYQIILASASPRRQELLRTSGLTPVVHPSRIEEIRKKKESPINTPEDVDNNRLNGTIIFVPTRAVEFIAMDFIITNSGVTFE